MARPIFDAFPLCLSRLLLFLAIGSVIGGSLVLEYVCLEPQRGYESKTCNTTSSRTFVSRYREDFFAAFILMDTGEFFPEDVLGSCNVNEEKKFPSCDVFYKTICNIGQLWNCVRKGDGRPLASFPDRSGDCGGAIIWLVMGAIGVIAALCNECRHCAFAADDKRKLLSAQGQNNSEQN